jgi:hypothetical protein
MRSVFAAVLAALLAACSPPTGSEPVRLDGVELAVRAAPVRAGDTLWAELRNAGTGTVGYNLCSLEVERMEVSGWRPVEPNFTLGPCLDRLYTLEPGETAPTFRVLPAGMAAGSYRLSTVVWAGVGMDTRGTVRTRPFTVRR